MILEPKFGEGNETLVTMRQKRIDQIINTLRITEIKYFIKKVRNIKNSDYARIRGIKMSAFFS